MLEPDITKIKRATIDELYEELNQIDSDLRDFDVSAYRCDELYRLRGVIAKEVKSRIR